MLSFVLPMEGFLFLPLLSCKSFSETLCFSNYSSLFSYSGWSFEISEWKAYVVFCLVIFVIRVLGFWFFVVTRHQILCFSSELLKSESILGNWDFSNCDFDFFSVDWVRMLSMSNVWNSNPFSSSCLGSKCNQWTVYSLEVV